MVRNSNNKEMCVLTLPLCTEPWQDHIIEKRFSIVEHLKNQLIAMELRKLKNLKRTKAYRELESQILENPKENRKPLYTLRNKMLREAGFSEYQFKDDMAGKHSLMQKHFIEHITAQIAHKAASDVWRAFEKYLFGTGDEVHFHKKGTLDSVACQTIGNGMNYKDGYFIWAGGQCKNKITLKIQVRPPENKFEQEMLTKQIKNLRIVRKWMKYRYKYYLQFTLAGNPVQKDRPLGEGRVGIDIGTRTIAISAPDFVRLQELADRVNVNHKRKQQLQRKMDRSKRYANPENYNPDGTIRKLGSKKRQWVFTKKYQKLAGKVRELERKNADIRKYQHTCLANLILSHGNEFYVENMSFSGLQHRAKETKTDSNGRFLKKKRFGKSLANKAPASFLQILKTKAKQVGASYQEVDTVKFRASQFDHFSGEYCKAKLSDRWKHLSNSDCIQRDLYSAFLLMNSDSTYSHIEQSLCTQTYPIFKQLHDKEIQRILAEVPRRPSSFGI